MDIRLDGRAALITGGSEGLGKGMAIRFAGSGADVAILARRQDALDAAKAEIDAAGPGKVVAISCDLLDAGATADAFATAEAALGKIDILVNNAGTSRAGPFLTISDEEWHEDFELKLFAAVRLCRLALPAMQSRKWGRIINVLNIGSKAPGANGAPTAVARAAGLALTKVLAGTGAADNILVNALLVGFIKSGQWERLYEEKNSPTSPMKTSCRTWWMRGKSPWDASARPRNSPISPAFSRPMKAAISPAPRSTWMAGARRWFEGSQRQPPSSLAPARVDSGGRTPIMSPNALE